MGITMFSVHRVLSIAIVFLAVSSNVIGGGKAQALLWDRSTALRTVDKMQVMALLKPMYEMARSGNETRLLSALSRIRSDPDLQDPARDYVVYRFTLGLSDLEADAVSPAVILTGFAENVPECGSGGGTPSSRAKCRPSHRSTPGRSSRPTRSITRP